MQDKSFNEIISSIQKKELSPVDLTTYYLDRINRYNPTINAFVTVIPDEAIKQAKLAEEEIRKGI